MLQSPAWRRDCRICHKDRSSFCAQKRLFRDRESNRQERKKNLLAQRDWRFGGNQNRSTGPHWFIGGFTAYSECFRSDGERSQRKIGWKGSGRMHVQDRAGGSGGPKETD